MKLKLQKRSWLIVVIIVAIIGGLFAIGWWIYGRSQEPKKTTSSQQAPYKTIRSLSQDLGLKVDGTVTADLVYVKDNSSYSFSSTTLLNKTGGLNGGCGPQWAPAGVIQRYEKSWFTESDSFYTENEVKDMARRGAAKEFTTYYLLYITPQESCSPPGNQAGSEQQAQATALLKKTFDSIHE